MINTVSQSVSKLIFYKSSFVKWHIERYAIFIFRRRLSTRRCFRETSAILIAFISFTLFMQEPLVFAAEKDSPVPQPAQSGNPSVNAVTQEAVKAGALSCAGRINQIINFLSAGSQGIGAQIYVPSVDSDRKMVSVSLEIRNDNMPAAYAVTGFAPNQANGCGAMYEAVAYWNMKCDDVAAKQFTGLKKIGVLHKEIAALEGGAGITVFLMPAGVGCVSIKKEVVQ
ncbi:MAG: hypothetical protein HY886_02940 [Deltaproteobacteria bacterium]|nr:hypothetical protein [Deltaproteobacteria bacterium]